MFSRIALLNYIQKYLVVTFNHRMSWRKRNHEVKVSWRNSRNQSNFYVGHEINMVMYMDCLLYRNFSMAGAYNQLLFFCLWILQLLILVMIVPSTLCWERPEPLNVLLMVTQILTLHGTKEMTHLVLQYCSVGNIGH